MKKSSIQRLPEEVRDYLNELLRGSSTQLETTDLVNEYLTEAGLDVKVSKSAVNRYAVKMAKFGERIEQSREISKMWIGKLGTQPSGEVGNLLNEMVRTMAFDMLHAMESKSPDEIDPTLIAKLALSIERLEKASSENAKRERQIRNSERKDNQEKIEQLAKSKGLSTLTVSQIREALSKE